MASPHVLIVDDDPQVLEVAARALVAAGMRVSTARRVSVARDALTRNRFDLVVTDARLPGESGLALAETTRELGIATILMSGDHEWLLDRGIARGAYLEEPFALARLVELARLCMREGGERPAEAPQLLRK